MARDTSTNRIDFDPTKSQVVIVASKRAQRPKLFSDAKKQKPACPFCPGSEFMTPPTIFALPKEKNWKTRVFQNAFPALTQKKKASGIPGNAFGEHWVLVETSGDPKLFQDYDDAQLALVFETYVETMRRLEKIKGVEKAFLFKNHGLAGGASIPHEHSQAFAFAFNPPMLEQEEKFFASFKKKTGKCFYCDFLKKQPKVWENDFARVIASPYGRFAFEMWVMPKKHVSKLEDLNAREGVLLLKAIQECIRKTYGIVESYNFVFHETGHLHVEFYPRKSVWAGLELGAGVVINSRSQKDAMEQLR